MGLIPLKLILSSASEFIPIELNNSEKSINIKALVEWCFFIDERPVFAHLPISSVD